MAMNIGQMIVDGIFNIFCTLLVIAAAVLPVYFVQRIELSHRTSPLYWKRAGVVIKKLTALDSVADIIGRYDGGDIYRYVVFKGISYYYDRVVSPNYKYRLGQNELYMEPGVLYVTPD